MQLLLLGLRRSESLARSACPPFTCVAQLSFCPFSISGIRSFRAKPTNSFSNSENCQLRCRGWHLETVNCPSSNDDGANYTDKSGNWERRRCQRLIERIQSH